LTLSIEQKTLAEERVREAGFEGRIRVHLMDYREIPAEWEKAFDAFISIEMIEVRTLSPILSLSLSTCSIACRNEAL
jgi:cyclopropane fatty-acyl-phospholipid synthase-like methyltransferase